MLPPPELCPVAGGGRGTIEVLLPALGGETGDGFALVDDGGTAIVELGKTAAKTGARVVRAIDAGVEVVVVAAGGVALVDRDPGASEPADAAGAAGRISGASQPTDAAGVVDRVSGASRPADSGAAWDRGSGVIAAIEDAGGLRGRALVVLCDTRARWSGPVDDLGRDPRGVPMTAAGGGLAGALWARYGAQLVAGPAFVLEQLDFDARMRAARAVVVGEARLDAATLQGRVAGETAVRARQAGVPCHAVVAVNAIDRFDARILDLQAIVEAATIEALEAAGERLAQVL